MHILYIHQHFSLPAGSSGTRSYEFARRWIQAGHKVTLITGSYDIGGLDSAGLLYRKVNIEGIDVIAVNSRYGNKQSYLRRIISFCWFCILSVYTGLRVKKVDILYATSTPLTVGITAMVISRLKRKPYVFEVRDQWPEIPIQMGIIKNRMLIKFLLWLELMIYERSSAIVALSPGMAEGIRKKIRSEKKVEMVPNSCDIDLFRPEHDGTAVRDRLGWDGKLVLMHFGAMGRANGLDFVINAAEKLQSNKDIKFVLVGSGSEKQALTDKATRLKLSNVEILDSVPKTELVDYIAACDVSMVIFADFPILEHNSANKFFDSLSAGKPVLLNYSGWQRQILEDKKAGFGCDLCNLQQFIDRILYLNEHRSLLSQMGQSARQIAVEHFSRDKLTLQVLSLLLRQAGLFEYAVLTVND